MVFGDLSLTSKRTNKFQAYNCHAKHLGTKEAICHPVATQPTHSNHNILSSSACTPGSEDISLTAPWTCSALEVTHQGLRNHITHHLALTASEPDGG